MDDLHARIVGHIRAECPRCNWELLGYPVRAGDLIDPLDQLIVMHGDVTNDELESKLIHIVDLVRDYYSLPPVVRINVYSLIHDLARLAKEKR